MSDLTQFVVTDAGIEVFCGGVGVSWGFVCNDTSCTSKRFLGWEGPTTVAGAAVFHLQWHANGKPECRHCGGDLAKRRARTCPRGQCSVRDGGW